MKIEEAVKRIEQMGEYERFIDEPISKVSVLNTIRQINQPKPVVPKFIFDIIKKFKGENRSFYSLLENISAVKEAWEWLNMPKPGTKESELMQAWLAYPNITVEKEKLYKIIDKRLDVTFNCLGYVIDGRAWFWGNKKFFLKNKGDRLAHTRQQLIDAGFEEVFKNPNYEAKEVTE